MTAAAIGGGPRRFAGTAGRRLAGKTAFRCGLRLPMTAGRSWRHRGSLMAASSRIRNALTLFSAAMRGLPPGPAGAGRQGRHLRPHPGGSARIRPRTWSTSIPTIRCPPWWTATWCSTRPRWSSEYLDERYPHPPLMPVDPLSRARLRLAMLRLNTTGSRTCRRCSRHQGPGRRRPQAAQGTADRLAAAVQGIQVLPQPGDEPGRLRDRADRLAPAVPGRQLPKEARSSRTTATAFSAIPASLRSLTPKKRTCRDSRAMAQTTRARRAPCPPPPYLLRALNEWINDNGMTPDLLVDATQPGVQVPAASVKDGKVVLNIAARAVGQLAIDNHGVSLHCAFRWGQPVGVSCRSVRCWRSTPRKPARA